MPNMVDLYTPRTLAEVVKTTPPVRTFLRDRFYQRQDLPHRAGRY